MALGNWSGLAAAISCLGAAYAYRIPIEEGTAAWVIPIGNMCGERGVLVVLVLEAVGRAHD